MNLSLNELRLKQVVNVFDGKCLGHICDAIFDEGYGKLLGFVVPGIKKSFNIFKSTPNVFIPYQNICKIGIDVILVELLPNPSQNDGANFHHPNNIKATNYSVTN